MPACSSVGRSPEVEEQMIASAGAARSAAASSCLLQLEPLGRRLLHEVGAGDRLLDRATRTSAPSGGSGASVSRAVGAAGVLERLARPPLGAAAPGRTGGRRRRSAGSGPPSRRRSRRRRAGRRRAGAQPRDREREPLAHLGRAEHADVHRLEDRDRALDELGVRREPAAREIEVVLEPDADVAAERAARARRTAAASARSRTPRTPRSAAAG